MTSESLILSSSFKFFQKAIIVYEIYKNGAVAKDGRLWPGDRILEVRVYLFIYWNYCMCKVSVVKARKVNDETI